MDGNKKRRVYIEIAVDFSQPPVVDYIVENYVVKDDLCLDEQTENSIHNRINQSRLLALGKEAPNFKLPDINNNDIELYNINTDKLLLIFYTSWCPHCQELLPEINKLYKKKKSFEVVAVSLDEEKEDWINFINENDLNWINVSDLKGWNSDAAKKYYIYATPTLFMLDANKNILDRPTNLFEIKTLLD
ncbi:MAG: TlpA family protein disulfide reductase [Melioribacteraceae bacterium]|nr:TlpA family protein disulfide reductase [Melioribacteraceae bacterium]MCF8354479.1 TlpA family protein disulfide reductase [Melioribacteraceae bacterium]MCF8394089.1 TlpA family protein disulfide reductase [Melioribacteraceae bacterium]MCF8419858.1 TlpA family protein disulfide reductase [Melioribacteraceae bacterium]